jgi:hypothetical protein
VTGPAPDEASVTVAICPAASVPKLQTLTAGSHDPAEGETDAGSIDTPAGGSKVKVTREAEVALWLVILTVYVAELPVTELLTDTPTSVLAVVAHAQSLAACVGQ